MKRGKYFRIAADVIVDGESLADVLVEADQVGGVDAGLDLLEARIVGAVGGAHFLRGVVRRDVVDVGAAVRDLLYPAPVISCPRDVPV